MLKCLIRSTTDTHKPKQGGFEEDGILRPTIYDSSPQIHSLINFLLHEVQIAMEKLISLGFWVRSLRKVENIS